MKTREKIRAAGVRVCGNFADQELCEAKSIEETLSGPSGLSFSLIPDTKLEALSQLRTIRVHESRYSSSRLCAHVALFCEFCDFVAWMILPSYGTPCKQMGDKWRPRKRSDILTQIESLVAQGTSVIFSLALFLKDERESEWRWRWCIRSVGIYYQACRMLAQALYATTCQEQAEVMDSTKRFLRIAYTSSWTEYNRVVAPKPFPK